MNTIKVTEGCANCGFNAHPAALDFAHVRGIKLFNISSDPKKADALIAAELEKCIVLCANCHRIETTEGNHGRTKREDFHV